MKNIAICVITYNRIHSLERVVESLNSAFYNHPVELIISVDKSNSTACADYAKEVEWKHGDKRIIEHSENLGLRKHVFFCGDLLKEDKYDALVVLEDDISVSPSFFLYAEQCVEKFWDDEQIAGISLYRFPLNYHNQLPFTPLQADGDVYLQQTAQSWGQVWMKKQWMEFRNWYDQNSDEFSLLPHLPKSICSWSQKSWLKYHSRYCIEKNKYFVYPYQSLSTNNCDAGTHAQKSTLFQSPLFYGVKMKYNLNPIIRYDGFFENQMLYDVLSLSEKDICIDFYGEKENRMQRRYWLTREALPYKVVSSYQLSLKPYELNIIYKRLGTDLFLYDTTISSNKVPCKVSNRKTLEYLFCLNLKLKVMGIKFLQQVKKRFRVKMKYSRNKLGVL